VHGILYSGVILKLQFRCWNLSRRFMSDSCRVESTFSVESRMGVRA
jgi:hypothetical protein